MIQYSTFSFIISYLVLSCLSCSAPPAPILNNQRPIAEAGEDKTVTINSIVVIDGGESEDPDDGPEPLTYQWKLSENNPTVIVVALSQPSFEFIPTIAGTYTFLLTVSDGETVSAVDSVSVNVFGTNNVPPIADAGPNMVIGIGAQVPLSAINSIDPDNDQLVFLWRLLDAPTHLTIIDSTQIQSTFIADVVGDYKFLLTVSDGQYSSSDEITITVRDAANLPPIANAGQDQQVILGSIVVLNGDESNDPDGSLQNLKFHWTVGRVPGGIVDLSDSTEVQPSFIANNVGDYTFGLKVSDNELTSLQDIVTITVLEPIVNETYQMIEITSGNFSMGSNSGASDESPPHMVTLSNYWIDKFEVSVIQYQKCVSEGECSSPGSYAGCNASRTDRDKHPINCVNWQQANDYCNWANKRLPTEAEWEYSAKGNDSRQYPWGDDLPSSDYLNFNNQIGSTTPSGNYPLGISYFGVHNMGGNVQEWTADYYDSDYYSIGEQTDPSGPNEGTLRVVRGASWKLGLLNEVITTTVRFAFVPNSQDNSLGFRCATDELPSP